MSASLEEVQRAFTRICFDREPSDADFAVLHDDRERWMLYRGMVRRRLLGMLRQGLPKTAALLGPRFDDASVAYLAEHAPKTRFIREIVHELVEHALPRWREDPSLPAHLTDLVRYEDTKWRVGAREWPATPALSEELDFEGRAVMNPTALDVGLDHRVDKDAMAPARLRETHRAIVYRKPGSGRIHTYVLNRIGAELYDAWRAEPSFAAGARAVLTANAREPDARFIDGMAQILAEMVEHSIVLGSAG
ncbi:MAG: putative DNA-binding domain-containing protein [Sandaracinaceae bacterium]